MDLKYFPWYHRANLKFTVFRVGVVSIDVNDDFRLREH